MHEEETQTNRIDDDSDSPSLRRKKQQDKSKINNDEDGDDAEIVDGMENSDINRDLENEDEDEDEEDDYDKMIRLQKEQEALAEIQEISSVIFGLSSDRSNIGTIETLLRQLPDSDAREKAINQQHESGSYPLHIASSSKLAQLVVLFCTNGADVNVVDSTGATPLHLAAIPPFESQKARRHTSIAPPPELALQTLMKYKAKVDTQDHSGYTPIHLASLEYCNAYNSPKDARKSDITKGTMECISALIRAGARTTIRDARNDTLTHIAVLAGGAGGMHLLEDVLLEGGAVLRDMTQKNCDGKTPLTLAVLREEHSIARSLREAGSELQVVHMQNKFDIQYSNAFVRLLQLLYYPMPWPQKFLEGERSASASLRLDTIKKYELRRSPIAFVQDQVDHLGYAFQISDRRALCLLILLASEDIVKFEEDLHDANDAEAKPWLLLDKLVDDFLISLFTSLDSDPRDVWILPPHRKPDSRRPKSTPITSNAGTDSGGSLYPSLPEIIEDEERTAFQLPGQNVSAIEMKRISSVEKSANVSDVGGEVVTESESDLFNSQESETVALRLDPRIPMSETRELFGGPHGKNDRGVVGRYKLWQDSKNINSGGVSCVIPLASEVGNGRGEAWLTGNRDGSIKLWATSNGCLLGVWLGHTGAVAALATSPYVPSRVFSAGVDGTIRTWSTSDGSCTSVVRIPDAGRSSSIKKLVTPNGEWLVVLCSRGTIQLWHFPRNSTRAVYSSSASIKYNLGSLVLNLVPPDADEGEDIETFAVDPNEPWIYYGTKFGDIRSIDVCEALHVNLRPTEEARSKKSAHRPRLDFPSLSSDERNVIGSDVIRKVRVRRGALRPISMAAVSAWQRNSQHSFTLPGSVYAYSLSIMNESQLNLPECIFDEPLEQRVTFLESLPNTATCRMIRDSHGSVLRWHIPRLTKNKEYVLQIYVRSVARSVFAVPTGVSTEEVDPASSSKTTKTLFSVPNGSDASKDIQVTTMRWIPASKNSGKGFACGFSNGMLLWVGGMSRENGSCSWGGLFDDAILSATNIAVADSVLDLERKTEWLTLRMQHSFRLFTRCLLSTFDAADYIVAFVTCKRLRRKARKRRNFEPRQCLAAQSRTIIRLYSGHVQAMEETISKTGWWGDVSNTFGGRPAGRRETYSVDRQRSKLKPDEEFEFDPIYGMPNTSQKSSETLMYLPTKLGAIRAVAFCESTRELYFTCNNQLLKIPLDERLHESGFVRARARVSHVTQFQSTLSNLECVYDGLMACQYFDSVTVCCWPTHISFDENTFLDGSWGGIFNVFVILG